MHGNQRRPIARQVDSEIEYLKHDDHDTIDIVFRIFFRYNSHCDNCSEYPTIDSY